MSYNKGYYLALAPLYGVFGYDPRILTYGMPLFYGLYLGAMFVLYRMAYPRASLLAFVPLAAWAVLGDCLRRTKWHTIAYLPPLALLVFFLPEWRSGLGPGQRKAARLAGLGAYALSCFLYFGCFLYAGPFALLIAILWRRRGRRLLLGAGFAGALVAAAFAYSCHVNPVWTGRIENEWGYLVTLFSREGLGLRWLFFVNYYGGGMLTPPYLLAYLAGLAVLVARARRGDRFALIVLVLFGCFWVFQVALEGLNNPDQLNWWMIPTLLVLLAGADAGLRLVRERLPAGRTLAALIVAVVAWDETDRFPDYVRDYGNEFWTQVRDPQTEAALTLRMITEDRTGRVRYFLPDPAVPVADGGFDYASSRQRPDFAEGMARVRFFTDEADLRRQIGAGSKNQWAVVYLSAVYPPGGLSPDQPDPAHGRLLGRPPELVNPYGFIYRNSFLVRKFWFRPGDLTAAAAGP